MACLTPYSPAPSSPERLAVSRRLLTGMLGSEVVESEEFNKELIGTDAIIVYDKMRRSDAQVAALINACTLPLLSATWDIDLPDDEHEASKVHPDHIDFARRNLFVYIDFANMLRHITTNLWAGYAWFEKVYQVREGQLALARLSPRTALSVDEWMVDSQGLLTGVKQVIVTHHKANRIEYPREKVAVFVYPNQQGDYYGLSLLRPVYKHWKLKDAYYKFEAIRAERYAVGVPLITLPLEVTEDMLVAAEAIGKQWKGAEQSYVVAFDGMKVELMQLKGGEALDLTSAIKHHNEEIAKTGLAQFVNFGTTETGSRALGESSMSFFYDACEAWAKEIAATLNREVLWPLLDLNYADRPRPTIVFRDLGSVSTGELVGVLRDVGTYLPPDLEIENALRERLHLRPRLTPEEKMPASPAAEPLATPGEPEEELTRRHSCAEHLQKESEVALDESEWWRPLRPAERHVALRQIAGTIDDQKDRVMRILLATRNDWMSQLAQQIYTVFEAGPEAILDVEIPDTWLEGPQRALLKVMGHLFQAGRQTAGDEVERQMEEAQLHRAPETLREQPITAAEIDAIVNSRTRMLITRLKRTTEEAAHQIAIDLYRVRGPQDLALDDIVKLMSEVGERVERDARLLAGGSVTESFNLGRDFTFHELKDQIATMEYSAILDQNTCEACASADGEQMQLDSDEYLDLLPPLRSSRYGPCEGMGRCRCIMIAVANVK